MGREEARFRTVSAGPPFGAVLLDLDGCLIGSNDTHARAWSEALRRFGRSVPAARVRFQIGKGGSEMLRDLVSPPEHYFLASAMGATETEVFLRRFRRGVRPVPDAAKPDPLGGDSFSRRAGGLRLTMREFRRPPAPRWRKKRKP